MIGRSRYLPRSVDDVSIKRVMVFDGDVFEGIFFLSSAPPATKYSDDCDLEW